MSTLEIWQAIAATAAVLGGIVGIGTICSAAIALAERRNNRR